MSWVGNRNRYWHIGMWVVSLLVGSLLAICFEHWAIYAVRRWEYAAMPLVPVIRVGVTPLSQMIIVPVLTLGVCWGNAVRGATTAACRN